jgi:acetyl-CoA acyltransferase
MEDAFIVAAKRTAIGRKGKSLSLARPEELLAEVLQAVVKDVKLDPNLIDDVLVGCVYQVGEQGCCVARNATVAGGFPADTPASTLNRQCGSALSAFNFCATTIRAGEADVMIAGGIELMSKYPIMSDFWGLNKGLPFGQKFIDACGGKVVNQGEAAELIAKKWGITREQMDEFGYHSHLKAAKAQAAGKFKAEIAPVEVTLPEGGKKIFDTDEGIRPDTTLEKLAALKPALGTSMITAGNSSQISDGASAVLLMSGKKCKELGIKPRARFVASSVVGDDPVMMLTGPIAVTRKILKKTGMKITDFDVIEINEAFASVPLAWAIEHQPDPKVVNINGGAIALGHPVGNTGTRLVATALCELEKKQGQRALITLCTGGGMAPATIIERV